jgi:hypothetical protein
VLEQKCRAGLIVVVIIIDTFSLLATNAVSDLFLFAFPLVFTRDALVTPAVAAILALISPTSLLPTILPVIGVSSGTR